MTPYSPIAARTSAMPAKIPSSIDDCEPGRAHKPSRTMPEILEKYGQHSFAPKCHDGVKRRGAARRRDGRRCCYREDDGRDNRERRRIRRPDPEQLAREKPRERKRAGQACHQSRAAQREPVARNERDKVPRPCAER